jgi:hypothetical protein
MDASMDWAKCSEMTIGRQNGLAILLAFLGRPWLRHSPLRCMHQNRPKLCCRCAQMILVNSARIRTRKLKSENIISNVSTDQNQKIAVSKYHFAPLNVEGEHPCSLPQPDPHHRRFFDHQEQVMSLW